MDSTGITLIFNDLDEFMEQLETHAPEIVGGEVRVTRVTRSNGQLPIAHLFVVSTYIMPDYLVKFERSVGDLWSMPNDEKINAQAQEIMDRITPAATDEGLDVGAGVFTHAGEKILS